MKYKYNIAILCAFGASYNTFTTESPFDATISEKIQIENKRAGVEAFEPLANQSLPNPTIDNGSVDTQTQKKVTETTPHTVANQQSEGKKNQYSAQPVISSHSTTQTPSIQPFEDNKNLIAPQINTEPKKQDAKSALEELEIANNNKTKNDNSLVKRLKEYLFLQNDHIAPMIWDTLVSTAGVCLIANVVYKDYCAYKNATNAAEKKLAIKQIVKHIVSGGTVIAISSALALTLGCGHHCHHHKALKI